MYAKTFVTSLLGHPPCTDLFSDLQYRVMDTKRSANLIRLFSVVYLLYRIQQMECVSPIPNMYYTSNDMYTEVQDGYCLYYHTYATTSIEYSLQHHVHTYCFRSNGYLRENVSSNRPFTLFSKLREQRITSQQLYLWSAPIDTVERYEMYLMNISDEHSLTDLERFYNCTKYTFGPLCQFRTNSGGLSLVDIIYELMRSPFESFEDLILFGEPSPCYVHLDCD